MKRRTLLVAVLVMFVALGCFTGCDIIKDLFGLGGFELDRVEPVSGIINGAVTISVFGEGLDEDGAPGLSIMLVSGATIIEGANVNYVSGGQVNAEFILPDTPMVCDVLVRDESGHEQTLGGAFGITEFEIVQAGQAVDQEIDVSVEDVAYDFSVVAGCVPDSLARDVTFTLDGGDPALTLTAGSNGGVVTYAPAFANFEAVEGVEANEDAYVRADDATGFFPCLLEAGQSYGLLSVSDPNTFVILQITGVDKTADTFQMNFMIVHKLLPPE